MAPINYILSVQTERSPRNLSISFARTDTYLAAMIRGKRSSPGLIINEAYLQVLPERIKRERWGERE